MWNKPHLLNALADLLILAAAAALIAGLAVWLVRVPALPQGCVSAWAQYTVRIAGGKRLTSARFPQRQPDP